MLKKALLCFVIASLWLAAIAVSGSRRVVAGPALSAAPGIDSENVDLVGHLGGASYAAVASGAYLYAGFGPELAVLDIAHPAYPTRVGYVVLPGIVKDIAVVGSQAYVAVADQGLSLVEISDPNAPQATGFYDSPGTAEAVDVAGNYAYLADGAQGLRVIDVSQPAAPVEVGAYPSSTLVKDVAVRGDDAFLAADEGDLLVLNVADPAAPVIAGARGFSGEAVGITLEGDYAYVASDYSGLTILDISNPAIPVVTGILDDIGYIKSVTIAGDIAYACDWYGGTLNVVDISDPSNPSLIQPYWNTYNWRYIYSIALAGGYGFVTAGLQGLTILDLAQPDDPVTANVYGNTGRVYSLAKDGNLLYAATDRLSIVDVTEPADPYPTAVTSALAFARYIGVRSGYAYLGADNNTAVSIVDVHDPVSPTHITTPAISGSMWAINFAGNYAYLGTGYPNDGFEVLDISNPIDPDSVAFLDISCGIQSVTIRGGYAYTGDDCGNLGTITISDPANPTLINRSPLIGMRNATGLVLQGNMAYVSGNTFQNESGGLNLFNLDDPTQPKWVSTYQAAGEGFLAVDADGTFAYAAAGNDGLRLLKITDPLNPVEVGHYDTPGYAQDVLVSGNTIYLADGEGGLFIFEPDITYYAITGQVLDPTGNPLAGVAVSVGTGSSALVDEEGYFTLAGLDAGAYQLTPALGGYAFYPAQRAVSLPPDQAGQDFTILAQPVSISLSPGAGASLAYTDTQGSPTRLDFAADAVSVATTVTVTPTLAANRGDLVFTGSAFELGAAQAGDSMPGFTFNLPVTVTLGYPQAGLRLVADESQLALAVWTDSGWIDASQTCDPAFPVDLYSAANTLTARICQAGKYALFGPTDRVFLPYISRGAP